MLRRPRHRARLVMAAAVLWLLGLEVLPGLHVALHAHLRPHHHDGDAPPVVVSAPGAGVVVRVSRIAGSGELRRSEVHRAAPLDASDAPPVAAPPIDPGHGRHSLAHRAVLFHAPPPPLPVAAPVWLSSRVDLPVSVVVPPPRPGLEPSARGPPAPLA